MLGLTFVDQVAIRPFLDILQREPWRSEGSDLEQVKHVVVGRRLPFGGSDGVDVVTEH